MSYYKSAIQSLLIVAAPLVLSACEVRSTITPVYGHPFDFNGDSQIIPDDIAGTWASDACRLAGGAAGSFTSSIEFSLNGQFDLVSPMYSGPNCSGQPLATVQVAGNYDLGEMDSIVPGTTDANFTFSSNVTVQPESAYAANYFNSVMFCGVSSWQLGTAVAVPINSACLEGLNLPPSETILGISGDVLYTGNIDNTGIDPNSGMQFVQSTTPDLP